MNGINNSKKYFDVVVIGGGHAAIEAAAVAARIGATTLMITGNIDHIGQMSCNPSIGGVAKGHVVREIDAMGGLMGKVTDAATIWFKMLNKSRGPAVWSPRAQCDRIIYQQCIKNELEKIDNLYIHQAIVNEFIIENSKVIGIITQFEEKIICKSVIISTGTFLFGKLHYGMISFSGGRFGDLASVKLPIAMREQLKLKFGRFKTGTPQRVIGKSINFSKIIKQDTEISEEKFTFFDDNIYPRTKHRQISCYIAKAGEKTIKLVKDNINKLLYKKTIKGVGARYCPSFEDKVIRFSDKDSHTLYIEPEGEYTDEYYINGFSTSMPPSVQNAMIHSIAGFEHAQISRYAYAIEYDFVFPNQIRRTLSLKNFDNIFLAGQINGTSGYEEAAGQGLIAGINASNYAFGNSKSFFEMGREQGYIGVMIDDIVNKNIIEPYRLFTSRAEYRLRLRQDCADIRLCSIAHKLGILSIEKYNEHVKYISILNNTMKLVKKKKYGGDSIYNLIRSYRGIFMKNKLNFPIELINLNLDNSMHKRAIEQIVIQIHYEGYIKREDDEIIQLNHMEKIKIPLRFDYSIVNGLSNESRDKLFKFMPTTFAQASRIDGVTPAELIILRIFLKKFYINNKQK